MTAAGGPPRGAAIIVVDLGFGDAGKGLATDFLVRRTGARLVVRYNGGAQAGHNVVAPDGRHHTFAQLGSGTFVPGVRTFLSRHVVVHPAALIVEASRLARLGLADAMERLSISDRALVITPFQQASNRIRELARGDQRHGSCGVGIGETTADALAFPNEAIRAGDLRRGRDLVKELIRLQDRKRAELVEELLATRGNTEKERRLLEDATVAERWLESLTPLRERDVIVDDEGALAGELARSGGVVFEGAQGVLLDEMLGFHPHTTWSSCTPAPALALLRAAGWDREIVRLGVLRTYAHRHGSGPLPTEDPSLGLLLPEPHNVDGPWQGAFRVGWPDLVLSRYAVRAAKGVDALALTHLDACERIQRWRICRSYRWEGGAVLSDLPVARPPNLEHQSRLTAALFAAAPVYSDEPWSPKHAVAALEANLNAPVALTARGPTCRDAEWILGGS